ncbi:hypothetical protein [Clostridium sp.]|uniref:hypothetical protein n=1 Tax=Clostridium sp. TaxID=1506 RepID=UPI0032164F0B
MDFIKNHRVIIIDDNYKEALPVIGAFAKKGVATIYWNGKIDTKPEEPLEGIRFVFLDMRLSFVTDPRSVIAYLFTLLKSVLSMKNGPYILFIWSKHDNEYLEYFKSELLHDKTVPKPYLIINMEKSNFIETKYQKNEVYYEVAATLSNEEQNEIKDEILDVLRCNNINETIESISIVEDGVNKLINSLDEKMKQINALSILLMWENIVNVSARNLVNDIANLSEVSGDWDNNIKTLIQNLALANGGKSLEPKTKDYIINALTAFNQMLPDELWNQLIKSSIDEDRFKFINNTSIIKTVSDNTYSIFKQNKKYFVKKNNSDYTSFKNLESIKESVDKELCTELYNEYLGLMGKSNFKLLCERNGLGEIKKVGSIYEIEDSELLQELCNSILQEEYKIPQKGIKLIKLDVSSACDYAQDKLKRIRLLPGIMIEEEYFLAVGTTDDIYCTPELNINNKLVKLVFNFHYITNESKENLENISVTFSFRDLLLSEIKHKLSAYISRVGIVNL